MSTTYTVAPNVGPDMVTNLDIGKLLIAQPTSPSASQIHSAPELFTQFAQQTVGSAAAS